MDAQFIFSKEPAGIAVTAFVMTVSVPRPIILFFPPMRHRYTGDNTFDGWGTPGMKFFSSVSRLLDLSPVARLVRELCCFFMTLFFVCTCRESGRSGVFFSSSAWNFNFNNGNENYNNRSNDNNNRAFAVRSRV